MSQKIFPFLRRYRRIRCFRAAALALCGVIVMLAGAAAPLCASDVVTQHNDAYRTGAKMDEVILNTHNVNTQRFGLLFTRAVDGLVFTQPLFLEGLAMPGRGVRNVFYVATENNTVFCFDADNPAQTNPLWSVSLGPVVPTADMSCDNLGAAEGITSTPVINRAERAIYVVAKTKENGNYFYRLHALDLTTGHELLGGPVQIQGAVEGSGGGSDGAFIRFDPLIQMNRPALLLSDGVIYICFGAECDNYASLYHGWVFGYSARTLRQESIYCDTPNGVQGGIWMSGNGPSVDAEGNIYVISGNGTFDGPQTGKTADLSKVDLGDSIVKLTPTAAGLKVADFFSPTDQAFLDQFDYDLGSIGVISIPGTKLVIGGGKENLLYLCQQSNLGKFNPADNTQIPQTFRTGPAWTSLNDAYWLITTPVFLPGPSGAALYSWIQNDVLKAFSFDGSKFSSTPTMEASDTASYPGGVLSLSSNANRAGTSIVWATHSLRNSVTISVGTYPGIVRAFDASNLSNELWNSEQNHDRDAPGAFSRFTPPTVANGKVYVATFSNHVAVYGLLPPP